MISSPLRGIKVVHSAQNGLTRRPSRLPPKPEKDADDRWYPGGLALVVRYVGGSRGAGDGGGWRGGDGGDGGGRKEAIVAVVVVVKEKRGADGCYDGVGGSCRRRWG